MTTARYPLGAYTIAAFCRAHGISRGMFYRLQTAGQAPRFMRVGRRVLISMEAAADWRRRMEAEADNAGHSDDTATRCAG